MALTPEQRQQIIARLDAKQGRYAPPPVTQTPTATAQPVEPEAQGGFGQFISRAGDALGVLTSGRNAANAVGNAFGFGDVGSRAQEAIESIPVVGKPLGFIADVATSPLTVATAGFGGLLGAGVRGATAAAGVGRAGKVIAPLVEPLVQGGLGARVGAAVGTAAGSEIAGNLAEGAGLPAPVQAIASLAGGLGGLRTASNLQAMGARTAGGLSATKAAEYAASSDPVKRFAGVLSTASVDRKAQELAMHAARVKQAGRISENLTGVSGVDARQAAIRAGQKGALTEAPLFDTAPLNAALTPDDIMGLRQRVSNHYANLGRVYEEGEANDAMAQLLLGNLPTNRQVRLLEQALGTEVGGILSNLTTNRTALDTVLDIAGIPRAVMASLDASFPLRQGMGVATHPEWRKGVVAMGKAMKDEKYAAALAEDFATSTDEFTSILRDKNLIKGLASGGRAAAQEEYRGAFASAIPGVAISERGAVSFNNFVRDSIGKRRIADWEKAGKPVSRADKESLADWLGTLTGAGDVSALGQNTQTILNALMFSPQFVASRVAMFNPKTYMNMTPLVRKAAAADMARFIGTDIAILGLVGAAGKSGLLPDTSVEINPLSSDFAKVKIGDTRYDPWGGLQPYVRYAAQFLAGQAKTSTGDFVERNRAVTLGNLARGKAGPIPSFVIDAMMGESMVGEEVDATSWVGSERAAAERIAPLFLQDLIEGFEQDGAAGLFKTLPSGLGLGAQTYQSVSSIRGAGAEEMFSKPWDELTGDQKDAVNAAYADQIAKQRPSGAARQVIDAEDVALRAFEQQADAGLRAGTISNRQFTQGMQDATTRRIERIRGAVAAEGNDDGIETPLDTYFGLREQATGDAGVVDYEKLDQLQNDYLASLPEKERFAITERTSFAHAPEVKWWVDAKKTITDSGYYDQQERAMKQVAPLLERIGVGGKTYRELVIEAGTTDDVRKRLVLMAAMKRIDDVTDTFKTITRRRNPELDKALSLVYGSKPLALRG